jgi:hypothetical protein
LAIDDFSFAATATAGSTNAPAMSIEPASANQFILSWPASAANFQLFAATNLTPPIAWTMVTNQPAATNGMLFLTLPENNAADQFFRLMSP